MKNKKINEKPEDNNYTIIKVVRSEDLSEQIGKDIYFDLVDHDKVRSFRILNSTPFALFKVEIAKELGVPVPCQRFWRWTKRMNNTYRPYQPLTCDDETQFVGQLRKAGTAELILFLEIEIGLDLRAIHRYMKEEDILLFFKLYNPEIEELRYVGNLSVKGSGKPVEILKKLNEMAGFAHGEEIKLYEEIKFEPTVMCEPVNEKLTFHDNQLGNGDIICFQKCPTAESQTRCRYSDIPSFLEYVRNLQVEHIQIQRCQTCMSLISMATTKNSMPTPVEVIAATPSSQSSTTKPLPEYIGAGQLFEEGQHHQGVLDDKFEVIGGFTILKTQASLYKQIWLKYGHIASSQVTDSYFVQVTLVTDIMTSIEEMHHYRLTELSLAMIDSWEKKIKMVEKLEFNVSWLRECFENVKKDFHGEEKLKTTILEQVKSLQAAKALVIEAQNELKKAVENVSALETSVNILLAEDQMYLKKCDRLLFDGWL